MITVHDAMSHHLATWIASQLHDFAGFSELLDYRFVYKGIWFLGKQYWAGHVKHDQLQLTYVANLIMRRTFVQQSYFTFCFLIFPTGYNYNRVRIGNVLISVLTRATGSPGGD